MDVTEKVVLVSRPPTEEVVTQDELLEYSKQTQSQNITLV